MKNENQHFSADRRKFGRHFWIGAAVAGALSAAVIFTAASAVYRKNLFRSENRRRKSWIKGISALYGSCKI